MQIKKSYQGLPPGLIYDQIRDLILKHGLVLDESSLGTYSLPEDSSSFIYRGILTFKAGEKGTGAEKIPVRISLIGLPKSDTRVIFDIDETMFSAENIASLQDDLRFLFGTYELKEGEQV